MKIFESECNELIMMGIGILCIFHSFPLKKWVGEGFFIDFFDFQKNTCHLNGWPTSPVCKANLPIFADAVNDCWRVPVVEIGYSNGADR